MVDIEKYLRNEISGSERDLFEADMANNEQLRKDVQEGILVRDMIIANAVSDIKLKMNQDLGNMSQPGKYSFLKWFSLVAILCLSTALIVYLKTKNTTVEYTNQVNQTIVGDKVSKISAKEGTKVEISGYSNTNSGKRDNSSAYQTQPTIKSDSFVEFVSLPKPVESAGIKVKESENKIDLLAIQTKIPCTLVYQSEVSTQASCDNASNGKITILSKLINGGKPPYEIKLSESVFYSEVEEIGNLKGGTYSVLLKDKNGCEGSINNIQVNTVACNDALHVFNPSLGEEWELPLKISEEFVSFTIIDKNKTQVYSNSNKDRKSVV